MRKKKTPLKGKNSELKLVKPIMKFNIGLLGFEIDIQKTKKSLREEKEKKK